MQNSKRRGGIKNCKTIQDGFIPKQKIEMKIQDKSQVEFFPFQDAPNQRKANNQTCCTVLDRRLKVYGRSRRFRTYGYGGRSLRPFLRLKVFIGSFPRFFQMEAEICFSLHMCHTVGQDRQKCKETSNLDVIVMDMGYNDSNHVS